MNRWEKAMAVAMASFLLLSTTAFAAIESGAALRDARLLTIQPGPVRGVVHSGEGKGLGRAVVDVRDARGEVLGAAVTKADGSFCLAAIPAGEFTLAVNGDATFALHVAKGAAANSVTLVVPSPARYSAGQEESVESGTTGLIASGLALGVLGLAVVLSDSSNDCE
ncbi:MAG TPA: carboxypeptidase-like regulatory domain-containing protein [Candidatus Methanoperedens sp.]|nr:carboxypeptidase-like regulatory domain-containing protein [Candidatus Methanoperedens sp.]